MKQDKIASESEILIRQAALQATSNFLKKHHFEEHSKNGQLLISLQDEIINAVLDVVPDFDKE